MTDDKVVDERSCANDGRRRANDGRGCADDGSTELIAALRALPAITGEDSNGSGWMDSRKKNPVRLGAELVPRLDMDAILKLIPRLDADAVPCLEPDAASKLVPGRKLAPSTAPRRRMVYSQEGSCKR